MSLMLREPKIEESQKLGGCLDCVREDDRKSLGREAVGQRKGSLPEIQRDCVCKRITKEMM